MKTVFLAAFGLAALAHLVATVRKNARWRNYTKPFLMLTLLGFYLSAAPTPRAAVVLALIFSWLGDVLLMRKGTRWFAAGGIAFLLSHVCYILCYRRDLDPAWIPAATALVILLACAAAVALLAVRLRAHLPKRLYAPMMLYLLLNAVMNGFALLRCVSLRSAAGLVTAVGASLFFISDAALFFVRFKRNTRQKSHFFVMSTYTLGELLIILGLL